MNYVKIILLSVIFLTSCNNTKYLKEPRVEKLVLSDTIYDIKTHYNLDGEEIYSYYPKYIEIDTLMVENYVKK